jgi:hypothetical protein
MRLRQIGLAAAAALAAVAAGPARADPLPPLIVYGDFRNAGNLEEVALNQLERRLNEFRTLVHGRRAPTFGRFRVVNTSELNVQPFNRWKPDTLAMMWGDVERGERMVRPDATVYVGPWRVRPVLRRPINSFGAIRARMSQHSRDTQVAAYVVIIGYALMLREWQQDPRRVAPIAAAMEIPMRAAMGTVNGTSLCFDELSSAIKVISERAARGERPSLVNQPPSRIDFVDCGEAG